ncbi:MAG: hypothetical protein FWB72_01970 [Firmicutes bacterium]|nr:hypothetical protein [Bacillota bacterium]
MLDDIKNEKSGLILPTGVEVCPEQMQDITGGTDCNARVTGIIRALEQGIEMGALTGWRRAVASTGTGPRNTELMFLRYTADENGRITPLGVITASKNGDGQIVRARRKDGAQVMWEYSTRRGFIQHVDTRM